MQNRKNMKRAIYLLVITLIMSSVGYAQGILNSGTIDGMINWTVYEDGRLTLDGSGSIADYSSSSSVPWYQNRTAITSIELSGDISSVGKYAFYACTNVTQITSNIVIPPTLATNTFNSSRLSSITLFVPSMYISDYQTAEYWNQMQVQSSDGGGVMTDASAYLIAIYIDGSLLEGFDRYTFDYQVSLPDGTETAPYVTYQAEDESAIVNVSQADSPNGFAKIVVESADGMMTNTYQITFTVTDSSGNPDPGTLGDGYTVYWSVNGTILSTTSVEEMGMISELPETPTICDGYGYMFAGWTDTPISGSQGSEPSPLYTNTYEFPSVSSNVTYYAVFRSDATAGGGTYEMTDVLTRDMTGVASGSTNYTDWSGIMASSSAMYAGNSAGGNDAIQLRSSGNNSGIITTASGGTVTMVSVEWSEKTSAGQTLNVYGSYTPFTSVSELYSGGSATQIGTIVKGSSTELPVSGYEYIGVRSANGALYLNSISITWSTPGAGGTTEYVTSCGSNPGGDGDVIADGYFGDGDGLYWQLYGNGQLTIDGVGDMPDFSDENMQPWANFRDQIYDVNFNAQTTKVGNYAFAQCSNLNTVTLASSTNQIGDFAFSECSSLTRITIPANEVISSSELAFGYSFDRKKMTIEVPESMVDAYKGAMFWYEFNIVAMGGSEGGTVEDDIVDGLVEGDIRWSFKRATGLLSIYGFGAMPDWIQSMAPWGEYVDAIQEVEVCYGITYVCNGAFANCPNITKVTTAASVNSIGEYIFTSNNSPIQFYVQNMTPPSITSNTFANVNDCVYAYCYESAFTAYDNNPLWNDKVCLGFDTDPEDPNLREYQLQMIYINNIALADFNPDLYNYNITLSSEANTPLVTYKPAYTSQNITVEQASSPDGKAYIHVNESATYSLYFAVDGGGSQQGDEVVTFELDSTWRFIMLPTLFGLSDDDVTTSDEVEWATYSGMQRASGRSGWAKVLSSATANGGVAYIVRAKNGSSTLNMNVPASASSSGTSIALTLEKFAASHQENANWNFIGNPYNVGYNIAGFAAMGITSPITVWNGTGYSTYTPGIDEYILQPFEPFFIQIPDDGSVSELMLSPEYFEGGNGSNPSGGDGVVDAYGALPGYFSVGEGVQVQFSRGNLQYNALKAEWQFADQQYDYIGEDNANISESYEGWIDLFGWGTGNNPTNTSTNNEDYPEFYDWGNNPISNGGYIESMWRTLTSEEWRYMFESRTNASNLYGAATVNGINGIVILPDGWSDIPDIFTFNPGSGAYSQNTYTYEEWSKMESAGAVFLPAAGSREGNAVSSVGTGGSYWSATYYGSGYAYDIGFTSSYFGSQDYILCSYGRSVRLVK